MRWKPPRELYEVRSGLPDRWGWSGRGDPVFGDTSPDFAARHFGPPYCQYAARPWMPPAPNDLAHVELTEADLLLLVGRSKPVNTAQAGIFAALVAAAATSLWFHQISRSGLRLSHFLAQCCHESAGFSQLREIFHYKDEAGLENAFGDRLTAEERKSFVSRGQQERYAEVEAAYAKELGAAPSSKEEKAELLKRKQASNKEQAELQVKLANKVYNGRMGNKAGSNDGWTYRGRGIIQLTGRENYTTAGQDLDLPLATTPEIVAEPETALRTAVWFWQKHDLNTYADADDCLKVGQAINRGPGAVGTNKQPKHHAERQVLTDLAKTIWGERQAK